MYYLYSKKQENIVPTSIDYEFNKFEEFYAIEPILTNKLFGTYTIKITSESFDDIKAFIEQSDNYTRLVVYINTTEEIIGRVTLSNDNVTLLNNKSSMKLWEELIIKYDIYFERGVAKKLFWNMDKTEAAMSTAILDLKEVYGNKVISYDDVLKVLSIEDIVYPKSVMYSYLMRDRFRDSKLKKSIEVLGNDIVFYSIRKNIKKIYEQKCNYYRTGIGSDFIKKIPFKNIIKLYYTFVTLPRGFKDISIILKLYEKGEYIHDYL